eukprot:7194622-Pyramimonas_sp.AAC.1
MARARGRAQRPEGRGPLWHGPGASPSKMGCAARPDGPGWGGLGRVPGARDACERSCLISRASAPR